MLTDLRKRLIEFDKQTTEQRLVLEQLQNTRSDVECKLHATATYPVTVLTLPTEIAAEIFVHCLPFFGPWSKIPRVCKKSAPIIIFAVCHAWQDIAFATPKFWSKLAVRLDDIPHGVVSEPGLVESYIDQWLDRAGNCPLSLDLYLSGSAVCETSSTAGPIECNISVWILNPAI
ncbi:hypothetical protein DFH08DRAFT_1071396 [Mycena albidolilacea]|uniref:F-box domain-containing protein n=1 Tax=Mycena albidolilacea TaxID=1033008 RepID=A0AAD7F4W8_9AGAR|nr:hypothetical protein DFH08DRAFT_1071396 [Mycena albidolilacea]